MPQAEAPGLAAQAEGILQEHRRLRIYLEKVEAALSAVRPGEATGVTGLASSLAELAPFLGAHFAREEEEGLFDRVRATWPHAGRTCERLQGDHRALLARLERLRRGSEAGSAAAEALSTLVGGVRSLLRDLARHEELENQLICGSLDDSMAAQD